MQCCKIEVTITSTFASRTLKASSFMNLFIQRIDRAFVRIMNNCLSFYHIFNKLNFIKVNRFSHLQ